jgi:hypothetical protein
VVASGAREVHSVSANPSAVRVDASCDLECPKHHERVQHIAAKTATIYMGPPELVGAFGNWDRKVAPPRAVLSDRHHKGALCVIRYFLTLSTVSPPLCCLSSCIVIARRGTGAPDPALDPEFTFLHRRAPAKPVRDAKSVNLAGPSTDDAAACR